MCNNPYAPNEEKIAEHTKRLVEEITGNYPMLVNQQIWSALHSSVCERGESLTGDEARIIVNWYDKVMADIQVINAISSGYLYALPGPDGKLYFHLSPQGRRAQRSLTMLLDYREQLGPHGEPPPAEGRGHSPIPDAFRQEFDKTWNKLEGDEGKPDGG